MSGPAPHSNSAKSPYDDATDGDVREACEWLSATYFDPDLERLADLLQRAVSTAPDTEGVGLVVGGYNTNEPMIDALRRGFGEAACEGPAYGDSAAAARR